MSDKLFSSFRLGAVSLAHRVVHAPTTRLRADPDLPHRLRHKLALAGYERSAFWGGGAAGYTDYPSAAALPE